MQDKAMTRSQDDGGGSHHLTRVDVMSRVNLGGDDWIFCLGFHGDKRLYIFIS